MRRPTRILRRASACAARGVRCGLVLFIASAAAASALPAAAVADGSDAAVLARLTRLRAAFLTRIDAEGYALCPAPQIELADPPTFGHYLAERNVVLIASWSHLSVPQRQAFEEMARTLGGRVPAQSVFENGTHRWVFVHELGHWWQACRHLTRPESYGAENGANRIALAFWREREPRFAAGIVEGFEALLGSTPSLLPPGQPAQAYFEANFRAIAQGDAYSWFQGKMIVELAAETPPPSFHRALSQPLYPW
jgi:hypothetical protein